MERTLHALESRGTVERGVGDRDGQRRAPLGIMLFEMLAGRPPFQAETPFALLFKHLNDPVPPIRELRPDLPAGLQPVLDKALAKEASLCFTSAGAFAAAFEQV